MKRRVLIACALSISLAIGLTGCGNLNRQQNAALIGGVAGAGIGAAVGRGPGAIIGGATGAVVGAAVGSGRPRRSGY